ncbi:hypothetical protein C2G38_2245315 [Gigaspora rosea]|uniref:Uncharacterized protein n=1 Tax=Gigaspora rosea TaxID=44941 RepID=A0A397V9F9_9GLOM|nr:hypothetical protein C2G38_2245315 [Gigaspora rosea]
MMRFSGNDEYKQSELTNKAGVGDDECENGDNPIYGSYSSRPSTPKKSSRKFPEELKKQLRRSLSFNHPHQTYANQDIDVAEVLATTVAFLQENNRKLDRLSDEVRSDGQSNNPIYSSYSSRPSTPKKSSPPTPPSRGRHHSLKSSDEKYLSSPPKGVAYPPNTIVAPSDAIAVLAASLAPPLKDNFINYDSRKFHEKSKKQLRRSLSFNQSNNPHQTSTNQDIDVAEVLATTVAFLQENNRKLDRLSDEVRSDGQSNEYDMDSDDSDSWQESSNKGKISLIKKKY